MRSIAMLAGCVARFGWRPGRPGPSGGAAAALPAAGEPGVAAGAGGRAVAGRRRRWAGRLVAAAAGVLAAGGLAIPPASADYGGLVYGGCTGNLFGCTT